MFMRSRTRATVGAAGLAVVTVVVAGCSDPAGGDTATEMAQSTNQVTSTPMSHVHGLGLNSADGLVYVATHDGLFTVGDTVLPVGEGRQDTMGFTITGPNTFLASGHPAPGQDGPSNLGLISTEDAGTTWRSVSAGGRDFHALTAVEEFVYALDSSRGVLMSSSDGGSTWLERAAISARTVDVSPSDPRRLLATTEAGLMVSDDGGATFNADPIQPPDLLVLIDHVVAEGHASSQPTVAGLDTAGQLWTFDGLTWTGPSASVGGAPHAFTAVGPEVYLAATETGIYRTDDAGRTWREVPGQS